MTPEFTVEKLAIGYRVTSEPDPGGFVKKTFLRGGNKGYSEAIAYAARWAAEANGHLTDKTGRASKEECRELVEAFRLRK